MQIRDGTYEDAIHQLRKATDKEERRRMKMALPCMTVSAIMEGGKKLEHIKEHSGYLIADIDNLTPDEFQRTRLILERDEYTYAVFTSAGGAGLCAIVKTSKWAKEQDHYNCFKALEAYYFNTHGIVLDDAGSNWNRLRAVSYDPNLYINESAFKFKDRIKEKEKEEQPIVWGNSDVERVLSEVVNRRLQLTNDYAEWVRIGASIHSYNPGPDGLQWFKAISQNYDGKYNERQVEIRWKSYKGQTKCTIATVLWLAKQHGIEPVSKANKQLTVIAKAAKRSGATVEITKQRAEAMGLADPDNIIDKVHNLVEADLPNVDLPINEQVILYINSNYEIAYNEFIHDVEIDGKQLEDRDVNSLILNAKRDVSEKVVDQTIYTILNSDRIKSYNPVKDYLLSLPKPDNITFAKDDVPFMPVTYSWVSLWADQSDGVQTVNYAYTYMARWGIGLVGTVLNEDVYNEIMPVLSGSMGDRKTRLIRAILPPVMQRYYAEQHFGTDNMKDFETVAATNILIMNDEYDGNLKKEAARLKAVLSAKVYTNRLPYARKHQRMRRMASFIATSNDRANLLADIHGNRRIVPIPVQPITQEQLDQISPEALLSEWVYAFQSGCRHYLTREEGQRLNEATQQYQKVIIEEELLLLHCELDTSMHKDQWQALSKIAAYLAAHAPQSYRFNNADLRHALVKHGYAQHAFKHTERRVQVYPIKFIIPQS